MSEQLIVSYKPFPANFVSAVTWRHSIPNWKKNMTIFSLFVYILILALKYYEYTYMDGAEVQKNF